MIKPPNNVLVSYAYFKNCDLSQFPMLNIIGDSGAFTMAKQGTKITVKELAEWAKTWSDQLTWVASLDVIGDERASRANWHEIVDDYGINAIPTIHYGANPNLMDYYAKLGCDYIGLGGLVGVSTKKRMEWLIPVFKHQRRYWPDLQFHGWGATTRDLLRLPFLSIDSSSWTQGFRYGQASVRDPRNEQTHKIAFNGKDVYKPEVAKLIRQEYCLDPADIAFSIGATRQNIYKLLALSEAVHEQRFQQMHPAPKQSKWIAHPKGIARKMRALYLANTDTDSPKTLKDIYIWWSHTQQKQTCQAQIRQ